MSGKQPVELVREGYAKSSVYHMAKKIRNIQPDIPLLPVDDELTELRRKKEIIKLQKDIAELEAGKERLPEMVNKLEGEVQWLNQKLPNLIATCYASLYAVILLNRGWDLDEAKEEAKSVGNDFIDQLWPQH